MEDILHNAEYPPGGQAYSNGLIEDRDIRIDMIESRNLIPQDYCIFRKFITAFYSAVEAVLLAEIAAPAASWNRI